MIDFAWEKSLQRHSYGAEEEGAGDKAIKYSLGQSSDPSAKTKRASFAAGLSGLLVRHPFGRVGVADAAFDSAHFIESCDCLPTTNNAEL